MRVFISASTCVYIPACGVYMYTAYKIYSILAEAVYVPNNMASCIYIPRLMITTLYHVYRFMWKYFLIYVCVHVHSRHHVAAHAVDMIHANEIVLIYGGYPTGTHTYIHVYIYTCVIYRVAV